VSHAALARLRVEPDDRLIGAADALRVDCQAGADPRQVAQLLPGLDSLALDAVKALLNGVLQWLPENAV
jgi:hypothetical protein